MINVENVKEGYAFVVGINSGIGKESKQPYCNLYVLKNHSFGELRSGFSVDSFRINPDSVRSKNIEVGDSVQILYDINGNYRNPVVVDVIKGVPFKDKK